MRRPINHNLLTLGRIERLLRYVAVGGGLAIFNSAFTFCLVSAELVRDPVPATIVATLLTQPLAFMAHRNLTFSDAHRDSSAIWRFLVVGATTLACSVLLMRIVLEMAWPFWSALIFGWFVIPIANLVVNSLWVFRVASVFRVRPRHRAKSDKVDSCG